MKPPMLISLKTLLLVPLVLAAELAAPGAPGGSGAARLTPHPDAVPNPHPPGDVDNPALVPFIVADPASLPGIVVDDTAATLIGKWQYSTHTPPYVGLGYLHDQKEDKGKKSVTFTPTLPRDTFRFTAGRAGWVRIATDGTDPKHVVIADAVQWLPQDEAVK